MINYSIFTYLIWVFNAHLAFFIYLFKRNSNDIWLVGGIRGEVYSDNSKVFYEFLMSEHPEVRPIWVARAGSSAHRLAKGEVVEKGSVKNYLYFYRARFAIFSDTFNHDIAPGVYLLPIPRLFYNRMFKVRLNHGTISFKKRVAQKGIFRFLRDRIMLSYDLLTASTNLEEKVMNSYARPGSVVLTGSARNDQVVDVPLAERTILLAPTWRTWLRGSSEFAESEFYQVYSTLLSDPKLLQFLREQNIKLVFQLHHLLLTKLNYFIDLECDVVSVERQVELLPQKIIGCSVLVTDYSSICAERYYLRKPVLFFQFDQARYISEIGSYIDLEKAPFGLVIKNVKQLLEQLKIVFSADYEISSKQIEGEKYFVHHKDNSNCERIFRAIEAYSCKSKA